MTETRTTAPFDADETRSAAMSARMDQEESFLKLLRALKAHPEPQTHAALVATIGRWATSEEVLRSLISVPAWFDHWEVREALFGNPVTDSETRSRIAAGLAIFELVRDLDHSGLGADDKAEIKDEIKNQIALLGETDRLFVRKRLKSFAGKKKADDAPAASPALPPGPIPAAGPEAESVPRDGAAAGLPPADASSAAPPEIDPTLLALFADLQTTVEAREAAGAAFEDSPDEGRPVEAPLSFFGFDDERTTGVVDTPIAPPPVVPPEPELPQPSPRPPVRESAPALPPPLPPVSEEPQYVIIGGEIVPLVEDLDVEEIRNRLRGQPAVPVSPAAPPSPPRQNAPVAAPPAPPAAPSPPPPKPPSPPRRTLSPPPPNPSGDFIVIEELHPFGESEPTPAWEPEGSQGPPPAAETPSPAPVPPRPAALRPKLPQLGSEERAELLKLSAPEKLSLASMTDRLDVLGALLRMKDERLTAAILENPNCTDALVAVRATDFSPGQVNLILQSPKWKKKGDVLVALLSNLVVTRPGAIAILKSMETPADLLAVMRDPEIVNPQLKQMAKDRLVERYWAMPVRKRIEFIRGEGTEVFQDLWEQIFRDDATLCELIASGNLDQAAAMQIATSPLAPRGVLESLGAMKSLRSSPELLEAVVRNPKTPKSTASELIKQMPPEARARLKKSITLSPALRALLG